MVLLEVVGEVEVQVEMDLMLQVHLFLETVEQVL
jgi:hypothetical protein